MCADSGVGGPSVKVGAVPLIQRDTTGQEGMSGASWQTTI